MDIAADMTGECVGASYFAWSDDDLSQHFAKNLSKLQAQFSGLLNRMWHASAMKHVYAFFLLIVLSGCGGTAVPIVQQPGFTALDSAANSLVSQYQNTAFTPLNTLPTSNTAGYDGYLGATIYNNQDNAVTRIVGQADIEITFGSAAITAQGSATAFQDESQGAMQGTLQITSGVLDRSGDPAIDPTFTAQAAGFLRWPDTLGRQLDLVLEGDLRGGSYDALDGEILGRHTANGGNGDVIGSFILTR